MKRALVHSSRRWLLGLAALGVLSAGGRASAAGPTECMDIVIVDTDADPGVDMPTGAAFGADLDLPIGTNAAIIGGDDTSLALAHAAVSTGRAIHFVDLEADPLALGPDPNGNPGRGAVLGLDPGTGAWVVEAASDDYVDPVGVAWSHAAGLLFVVDLDADPTGLGPDSRGFSGHGAVFAIDPGSGAVSVLADGSDFAGGLPPGRPSIFEDPVGIDVAADGSLYVVDQLAEPSGSTGPVGAVFRVDPGSGQVALVATSPLFRGLRDVAVEPTGTLLVVDRIGRNGTGSVHRVDPSLAPTAAVVASFEPPELVEPAGVAVAGNGRVFVADSAAVAPGMTGFGVIFEMDAASGALTPVVGMEGFVAPWGVELLEPLSLDDAMPTLAEQGMALTVTLVGGPFAAGATVDFGPGVSVEDVRVLDAATLEVDVVVDPGASPGLRDILVRNADGAEAFHCDLFDIVEAPSCEPTESIGESLRVWRPDDERVGLRWSGIVDDCLASYGVYRATSPRPISEEGDFPDDPDFADVTPSDLDGASDDTTFVTLRRAGENAWFLVVGRGAGGELGPVGHYGR